MKFQPLYLVLACVLSPSAGFSQSQYLANCHTPEASGNFIGPDETMANGMVCKIVKTQPSQQIAANQPASAASGNRNQPIPGEGTNITNARVIEMAKLGLDDDIIIARIKNANCVFQVEDTDLVNLKKAGVSPKVIAAMLDASARTSPQVAANRNDGLTVQVAGQSNVGVLPDNGTSGPGMYVEVRGSFTKILGQIVDFKRSGSMLASDLTLHIKTTKENVQLLGPHAQTVTGSNPEFYFTPAKQEADAGVNAGDLILVRLEEKKERRQFEIGAQGAWRASKGISLTHQVQLNRTEVKSGTYKIMPAVALEKGEYGLYLSRGEGMAPYIYDFSVQ